MDFIKIKNLRICSKEILVYYPVIIQESNELRIIINTNGGAIEITIPLDNQEELDLELKALDWQLL
jgi:hypothetical protein